MRLIAFKVIIYKGFRLMMIIKSAVCFKIIRVSGVNNLMYTLPPIKDSGFRSAAPPPLVSMNWVIFLSFVLTLFFPYEDRGGAGGIL